MIKWLKPNGIEIETNDRKSTIEYCKSLGWERVEEKKRGRPKKEQVNDNSGSDS